MAALCEANTTFALEMYKKITEENKVCNIFFSPLSMSSSLSMVLLGAKGDTAAQMSKTLQLDKSEDVHSQYQELITAINNPSAVGTLKMANHLFGEQTYNFLQDCITATKKFYHAELEALDFVGAPDSARTHINEWVEGQTQGKIQNLLASGTIDSLTRLVLVNAIYFKCDWDSKFKESNTKERPFRISKTQTKPVQMMSQKGKFNMAFIPDMQMKILELPYANKEKKMLIVLPLDINDDTNGLELVEKNLSYQNLVEWTNPNMMDNMEIMVQIPKFKLEDSYDLKPKLISMGMVDAFSPGQANFSGMSDRNDLHLSKVVHKAFVEVNEEGTEAAAATAAVMMLRCAPRVEQFNADHPFIFTILDCKTSTILFLGRFCSP